MKHSTTLILTTLSLASAPAMVPAQEAADVRCQLSGSAVAGMVVHIDPGTGRPTSRPLPRQAAELAALRAARANRSTEGLVQERDRAGGIMVNLRNRFRSPLVAVKNPDGGLAVDHLSCRPVLPGKGGGLQEDDS